MIRYIAITNFQTEKLRTVNFRRKILITKEGRLIKTWTNFHSKEKEELTLDLKKHGVVRFYSYYRDKPVNVEKIEQVDGEDRLERYMIDQRNWPLKHIELIAKFVEGSLVEIVDVSHLDMHEIHELYCDKCKEMGLWG